MGYTRHHAIMVTSWDAAQIAAAHAKAISIFPAVSALMPSAMNGYATFFVPPDGSKEGWAESADGDRRRDEFAEWLADSGLDWAEVQYGDDDGDTRIIRPSTPTMPEPGWRDIASAPRDGTVIRARRWPEDKGSRGYRTRWGKASHVPLYGWCVGNDPEDIDLWQPDQWKPIVPRRTKQTEPPADG